MKFDCEEGDGNRKKVVVLMAAILTFCITVVSGTLILGWCYIHKVGKNMKGKVPIFHLLFL